MKLTLQLFHAKNRRSTTDPMFVRGNRRILSAMAMAPGCRTISSHTTDFLIAGGGIIGVNMALALRKHFPAATITIIEKEDDVALHASGRNSGVLHAGFYYTMKAKLTRQGNEFLTDYCISRKLPLNDCGKLVVAQKPEDLDALEILAKRGEANGVPVELISAQHATQLEPLVKTYQRALWSPLTKSADPVLVTKALADDALKANVSIQTSTRFLSADVQHNSVHVQTSAGKMETGHFINCAGLYADSIAKQFGFSQQKVLLPFKGIYLYCKSGLKRLVYPVPNLANPFLGVHFTVDVYGNVKIGPTAIPAFWREQYKWFDNFSAQELFQILPLQFQLMTDSSFNFRQLAMEEMKKYSKRFMMKGASSLVHGITKDSFTHFGKAGIRAQLLDLQSRSLVMDFCVEGDRYSTHVLNAVSPAWTCSHPFAEYVVQNCLNLQ